LLKNAYLCGMSEQQAYTVGKLTRYIKQRLEGDPILQDVWVSGEVSNLTQHGSGHVYFSLKDEEAQISCAMFKPVAVRYLRRMPKHGAKLLVRGELSIYPPRGSYQLIVRELQEAGEGDLHQRFLALRDRLLGEGLFEAEHKQPIPRYPRVIGVATSPTGAVIRDIIDTIKRRYPHVQVVLAPTVVQGEAGADSIVRSLAALQQVPGIDTIILARGGGSLEDLWCFNEERVARAIFAATVPVISGVGHETDTTIADFVADLRAATPTAAAEQAVPLASELLAGLQQAEQQLGRNLRHFIEVRQQMLDDCARQLEGSLVHQLDRMRRQLSTMSEQLQDRVLGSISLKRHVLADVEHRLSQAALSQISAHRNSLDMMELQLQSYDFRSVLSRGFSLTTHRGQLVTDAATLQAGDRITTHYYQGKSISRVEESEEKND
jgi:exodeoxyribonuclease VII large subunit